MKNNNLGKAAIISLLTINLVITLSLLLVFIPRVSAATGCFPDTDGHWAETYICWLSDNGIAGGYPDGTYKPENNVTRAELAVFLSNINDYLGSSGVGPYYTQVQVDALLATERARIADLEATLASVTIENGGDDFVFTGVNLHLRDGTGDTAGTVNGLGNMIVGYNEDTGSNATRTGSHNLVVGDGHEYTSYGGFVAGYRNTIHGKYSSVSGGSENTTSHSYSSVSGGYFNTVSGQYSSISGGAENEAMSSFSSISGGGWNTTSDNYAAVSGGYDNTASGAYSSVYGGQSQTASCNFCYAP